MIFMLMELKVQTETKTNDERIDAVVEVAEHIYIFEFKLDKGAQQALDQIVAKQYARKYGATGKKITQVGVNFDSQIGQVSEWRGIDVL